MTSAWQRPPGWALALQYLRFGSVGLGATVVHVTLFALIMELLWTSALVANGVAFSVAVLVSFFGHHSWTFSTGSRQPWRWLALRRFVMVAAFGMTINSLLAWSITDVFGWPYGYALVPMVIVTPAILFVLSKWWAFASEEPGEEH